MNVKDPIFIRRCLWFNMGVYLILSLGKCIFGSLAHAQSIWADGLNNMTDLLLSLAMIIGFRVALLPADERHPFGHRRAEIIASLIAAAFMVIAAFEIILSSIRALFIPEAIMPDKIALPIALISTFIILVVSIINHYFSKRTNSYMLDVVAKDNRSDSLISMGAALGLFITDFTQQHWIDPLIALMVAGIVAKTAWSVGSPAIDHLMDGFDQKQLIRIRNHVSNLDGIIQIRELRARLHGQDVYVEMTIGVAPQLSVSESHLLTEKIEKLLIGYENIKHVHVHVEPQEAFSVKNENAELDHNRGSPINGN